MNFLLELHTLQDGITILPEKTRSDAAAAQHNRCDDGNDERSVRFPGFFRGGGDRRCFHVFLQTMTE